jgi:hypothetical protein
VESVRAFPKGCNVVVLDPDVAQEFPDSESVNQALRALAGIIVRKDPSARQTTRWTQNHRLRSVRRSWSEQKNDKSRLDFLDSLNTFA